MASRLQRRTATSCPSAGHVFEIVRLLEDVDEIPTVKRFSMGFLPKRSNTDAT